MKTFIVAQRSTSRRIIVKAEKFALESQAGNTVLVFSNNGSGDGSEVAVFTDFTFVAEKKSVGKSADDSVPVDGPQ
jgi:hypothetical protein